MTRISRVIIKCVTDCVTAHSCRIAINDLIWLQLSNQTIHYRCTYQYSHSIRLTTYSHNYANKRGKNLNDTKPCGYVRLELTKNPRRPLALPLLLSRIDLFDFCGYAWLLSQRGFSLALEVIRCELLGDVHVSRHICGEYRFEDHCWSVLPHAVGSSAIWFRSACCARDEQDSQLAPWHFHCRRRVELIRRRVRWAPTLQTPPESTPALEYRRTEPCSRIPCLR